MTFDEHAEYDVLLHFVMSFIITRGRGHSRNLRANTPSGVDGAATHVKTSRLVYPSSTLHETCVERVTHGCLGVG